MTKHYNDMKNIFKKLSMGLLVAALAAGMTACTADAVVDESNPEAPVMQQGRYVYAINLQGDVQEYGGQTRATRPWQEGDVLYLSFDVSDQTVNGQAVYSGGQWTLTTDQRIESSGGTCWATLLDNAGTPGGDGRVPMTEQTVVYWDKQGAWKLNHNTLQVQLRFVPRLGRLRFKGTSGTTFTLSGLLTPVYYQPGQRGFGVMNDPVTVTIGSTGYSPYIYGVFADTTSPTLTANGYTMECPTTMMQPGTSGWLNVPTDASHTGWTKVASAHEYVDLGLSVKWATCNVGAEKPGYFGDYYAWGETETKSTYDWSTYKWRNGSIFTKYCTNSDYGTIDNKTQLEPEDDVAHVKWGGSWRMPTDAEFEELFDTSNCTWTWTDQDGNKGYLVTSRKNGNSIFLPSAGYCSGSNLYSGNVHAFWSSSLETSRSNFAYHLLFSSINISGGNSDRALGLPVRPVCP